MFVGISIVVIVEFFEGECAICCGDVDLIFSFQKEESS